MDSCGEYFFFYGLTDFVIFFSTGLKMWLLVLAIFRLSFTRSLGFSCPHLFTTSSVQKTNFLFSFFRWREEGATSVLGSQPIIWLLPSSFPCQATRVRSQSTNICWSSLWPTLSLLTVILWWLATVNSRTGNSSNLISIFSVGHHVTGYF